MPTIRIVLVTLAWITSVVLVSAQKIHPALIRNHPAIAYAKTPVSDPIARLNDRMQRGEVTLQKNGPSGYLSSVLEALDVHEQGVVIEFLRDRHVPFEWIDIVLAASDFDLSAEGTEDAR